jgi:hypothetical protein
MIRRGLKHFSRVTDVLFRRLRIERDITIFTDDVFLTSFPRSGNTWTRFLVGNLVHQQKLQLLRRDQIVIDLANLNKEHRPEGIRTYEGICW